MVTNGRWIEEDVGLWLAAGGTREQAAAAFRARFGADAERRLERAARALAYLKAHRAELAAAGLVSFGESPGALHLEPRFAAELARELESGS